MARGTGVASALRCTVPSLPQISTEMGRAMVVSESASLTSADPTARLEAAQRAIAWFVVADLIAFESTGKTALVIGGIGAISSLVAVPLKRYGPHGFYRFVVTVCALAFFAYAAPATAARFGEAELQCGTGFGHAFVTPRQSWINAGYYGSEFPRATAVRLANECTRVVNRERVGMAVSAGVAVMTVGGRYWYWKRRSQK